MFKKHKKNSENVEDQDFQIMDDKSNDEVKYSEDYMEAVKYDSIKSATVIYDNNDVNVLNLLDGSIDLEHNPGEIPVDDVNQTIIMDDIPDSDDIFIIGNTVKWYVKFFKSLKILATVLLIVFVIFASLFIGLFKIIPEPVNDGLVTVKGITIISKDQKPLTDILRKGDKVIIAKNNFFVVNEYEKYTYISRNGSFLKCSNSNGKKVIIMAEDVSYTIHK